MAGKVLQARKESEEKIKGFDTARTNMRNVVMTISKKQEDLEARIVRFGGDTRQARCRDAGGEGHEESLGGDGG